MTETTILAHPTVSATIKQGKKIRVPPRVSLGVITPNNIGTLKKLNQSLFPINYSDKFYKEVLDPAVTPEDYSKLVFYQDLPVGNIICRVEPVSNPIPTTITTSVLVTTPSIPGPSSSSAPPPPSVPKTSVPSTTATKKEPQRLYIMTLGVLAPYRRQGLATKLVQHIITNAISSHCPLPPLPTSSSTTAATTTTTSPNSTEPDSKKRKTLNSSADKEKEKKEIEKKKLEKEKREKEERERNVVVEIYLHVQVGNDEARGFWEKNGFTVTGTVKDYYRKITPRDAWILERKIEKPSE